MHSTIKSWIYPLLRALPGRVFYIILGVVPILILAYMLLMSGMLGERLLPCLSERFVGMRVSFWHEGWNPLYLHNLQFGEADSSGSSQPLFRADVLKLGWRKPLSCSENSLLSNVRATNAQLFLNGTDPARPNYGFLLKDSNRNGKGNPLSALLPEVLEISPLSIRAEMPGWSAGIAGIHATFSIESLNSFSVVVEGKEVVAGWQNKQNALKVPLSQGRTHFQLRRDANKVDLDADVELPDFLLVKGKASITLATDTSFDVTFDRFRAEGPVFGELATLFLPVPVAFESVDISPARVRGAYTAQGMALSESEVNAQFRGLRVGDPILPWFAGGVQLETEGVPGETEPASFKATLDQGQHISGNVSSAANQLVVKTQIKDWNREQAMAFWPAPLEKWQAFPDKLKTISGNFSCVFESDAATFETDLVPKFSPEIKMGIKCRGVYAYSGELDISGEVALGQGKALLQAKGSPDLGLKIAADLKKMPAITVLSLLNLEESAAAFDAALTGAMDIEGNHEDGYLFNSTLSSSLFQYKQWVMKDTMAPFSIAVKGSTPPDLSALNLETGTVAFGESVSIRIKKAVFDRLKYTLRGNASGNCDMEALGKTFGLPDLWGNLVFEGTLKGDLATTAGLESLKVTLDPLGYRDYSLPYGQPLDITTKVYADLKTGSLHADSVRAQLDQGTTLQTSALTYSKAKISASGPITLKTDFAPLVAKGYLAGATGTLELKMDDFKYDTTGITGRMTFGSDASQIILPNHMGTLSGVSVQGAAQLNAGLSGNGTISVASLQAAGMNFNGLQGNILTQGYQLIADSINFTAFSGNVNGRAEVQFFETDFPMVLSGKIENADLGVFTTEFKPESVVLTGKVNGTFALGATINQLTMLDVDMESRENFSLNRDMVEQLLMRQYMQEMTGGRQMERVIRSVLGKSDQRSFDSAQLKLGLEEGRITGFIKLVSDQLDLTVDIKADPQALLEALRIRQQQVVQ